MSFAQRLLVVLQLLWSAATARNDTDIVFQHVASNINQTFREPAGVLEYKYLVPSGPYQSAWDWDSLFLGVASIPFGGLPYFSGTFMNFLAATNLTDGFVPGGLAPTGNPGVLYHAKPVIIQGAWLAARAGGSYAVWKAFAPQMESLLAYWERRVDAASGLPVWHDQLETGADNLVYSLCPSKFSPCWVEAADAFTLAAPDAVVFLAREHVAYANFLQAWAAADGAAAASDGGALARSHRERAVRLQDALNAHLWHWSDATNTTGHYVAFNTSTRAQIVRRTYQAAWPLWGNMTATRAQALAASAAVLQPDLLSPYGLRSTSSADPLYSNDNIINPYSEWRGPIWINVNVVLAHSLRTAGRATEAAAIADAIVAVLANDLVVNNVGWHECYSSEDGSALAAPGFLSWNTMAATIQRDLAMGVDPYDLAV